MHRFPFLIAFALAIGGGLLATAAFPATSWWWAAIVGLSLLMAAVRGSGALRGLFLGTVWGFAFFGPMLTWSLESVPDHWLPWFALSLSQALFIGGFGALAGVVSRRRIRPLHEALFLATAWVAIEQLRSTVPFGGFPWGQLAFSQVSGTLLSLAPWGGTVTVGLAVALCAAALAGLTGRGRPVSRGFVAGTAVIVILVSAVIPLPGTTPETGTLDVALMQASVPERGATWESQGAQITADYRQLTEAWAAAGGSADMVLWPESAADLDPRDFPDVEADVVAAQQAAGAPILLGTQRFPGDGTRFNEYVVWTEAGPVDVYAKQHPVPFGEYIPMRDFFRKLSSAVDRVGTDMAAGTEPGVLTVPVEALDRDVIVGVGICFEVAYDGIIREAVNLGAELIVIPTNNASFGFSQEPFQQRDMTRFRAVEHGRTAIQVASTGVSAVFGPDGSWITGSSDELYAQWYGDTTVPLRTSTTASAEMGEWPRIGVWVFAALSLLAALRLPKHRNHRKDVS